MGKPHGHVSLILNEANNLYRWITVRKPEWIQSLHGSILLPAFAVMASSSQLINRLYLITSSDHREIYHRFPPASHNVFHIQRTRICPTTQPIDNIQPLTNIFQINGCLNTYHIPSMPWHFNQLFNQLYFNQLCFNK